jgi:DNA polymerase III delta' subunit
MTKIVADLLPFPWHHDIWAKITDSSKPMHPARLFYGPSGIGKKQFAMAFSTWLLCDKPSDKACGQCENCLCFAAGHHPDFIALNDDKKVSIDQLREVVACLNLAPNKGKYRVVLIDHVESLSDSSANVLLKTLEEPSARVRFLLLASHPRLMLSTIRSRCQALNLALFDLQLAASWLKAKHPEFAQVADCMRALVMSGDRPKKALDYLTCDNTKAAWQALDHWFSSKQSSLMACLAVCKALSVDDFFSIYHAYLSAMLCRFSVEACQEDSISQAAFEATHQRFSLDALYGAYDRLMATMLLGKSSALLPAEMLMTYALLGLKAEP